MLRDDAIPAQPSLATGPDTSGPAKGRALLARALTLLGVALAVTVAGAIVAASSHGANTPILTLTNTSDEPMEVYIGGDRVRIIAPGDSEFLDLPPAAWAWKRRIAVRRWPNGELLLEWRADLNDLADNHWRLRIP